MRITVTASFGIALLALAAAGCGNGSGPSVSIDPSKLKMFKAVPESMPAKGSPITEAKVELGRMLYYEPRLSKSQKISCNTCHDLAKYGVDSLVVSNGHKGQKGERNAPTV